MTRKPPSYRLKAGKNIAVVTLTVSVTKERRDFCLAVYDSPKSRELYYRLIAEWEGASRRLPQFNREPVATGATVSSLSLSYF